VLAENVKIQFSGFEPTEDNRASLYYLLNRLHLISPSQSFLTASFTLTNGIFEGAVQITSTAGDFVAASSDSQIAILGSKLFDKIGLQLTKWKSMRFQ
jgi:hypothetical protein